MQARAFFLAVAGALPPVEGALGLGGGGGGLDGHHLLVQAAVVVAGDAGVTVQGAGAGKVARRALAVLDQVAEVGAAQGLPAGHARS